MENAVVYSRKSEEHKLATDVSFDDQESDVLKYAAEKGYNVVAKYRESHSGADLLNRPLIWQAIADIQAGRASVLLVRNYDRLSRKPEHEGVILYEIEDKAGGRVEAALEPIDPQDQMARMTRHLLAIVADGERQKAVARMENGKRHRVERGYLPGASNPKFGYVWDDDEPGKRTTYKEDTETAPTVRRIFHLAVQGQSLRSIANILTADHEPTPSQIAESRGQSGRHTVGERWRAGAVRRILTDRAYIGELDANKYKRVRSKTGKTGHVLTPEGQRVRLSVPAIVDRDTFNLVQSMVSKSDKTGRPPIDGEASWLRGHVYCGVCGSRLMIRRNPGQTYVYECRQRTGTSTNGVDCPGGAFKVRSHLLDPYAYRELTRTLEHIELLRDLMIQRLGTDKVHALAAMAESFSIQMAEKQAEYDRTRRLATQTPDGKLQDDLLQDAAVLGQELSRLQAEYDQTRKDLDNFNAGNAWVNTVMAQIRASVPTDNPTEADIRAFPLDIRRLLLDASGLYLEVWPTGWREDGKRVTTGWVWASKPGARGVQLTPTNRGTRRSCGSLSSARTVGW
jgi:DNA invertase Pin-like site-specific DNA recombinase